MPDSLKSTAHQVLDALPCSVTMPAGAGKTELIAAISAQVAAREARTLILTHTHAGVDALRRRLTRFSVTASNATVRTIDAWCFDLIKHVPQLAQRNVPEHPDWSQSAAYHQAAERAVKTASVQRMLRVSYDAILVDEYQDCMLSQHGVVLALAESVPTGVLGDPLQGLFRFGGNHPVDWDADVSHMFPDLPVHVHPWRWHQTNPALGQWLLSIREDLLAGLTVDLSSAPIRWVQATGPQGQNQVCYRSLTSTGSVVALGHFRNDCVSVSSRLGGNFTVMEPVDSSTMQDFARLVDGGDPLMIASGTVDFAMSCASRVAAHVPAQARRRLGSGKALTTRTAERRESFAALNALLEHPGPEEVRIALQSLRQLSGVNLHCREAWNDTIAALRNAVQSDSPQPVTDALLAVRNHRRVSGRRPEARSVGRPLLVKGLEYDHVILLGADRYNAEELYVALTRGSQSVTVLSKSRILTPRQPTTRRLPRHAAKR